MNENAKVFDDANNRLISLFSHPALQTKAAKKQIDEILEWSFISRENGINKEKLANKFNSIVTNFETDKKENINTLL